MKHTTAFGWVRDEHLGIRPPTSGDRLAVKALQQDHSLPDTPSLAGLSRPVNKSSTDRLLVEVDQQIAGSIMCRPGRPGLRLGRHPWSLLPSVPAAVEGGEQEAQTAVVVELHRRTDLDEERWRALLGRSLPGIVQRLGAERLVLPVRPATRPSLDPAAFLQQLSYRGLSDRRLTPLLEGGFELGGWRPASPPAPSGGWHAILSWQNPRRR